MTAIAALAVVAVTTADAPAIAAVLAADLATRFGMTVDAAPSSVRDTRSGIAFDMAVEQSFGVLAPVISSVKIAVEAAPVSDGTIWVKVDLDWTHPGGGRNGSTVGRWWLDGATMQPVNFSAN